MRYPIVVASILMFTGGAQAASLCSFTTRCFEAEPCQDTDFSLEFRAGTGGPNDLELVTDAETIGIAVGGTGKVAYLAGMTDSGFHVLTIAAGTGAARYTRHIGPAPANETPQSVSYLGSCELRK